MKIYSCYLHSDYSIYRSFCNFEVIVSPADGQEAGWMKKPRLSVLPHRLKAWKNSTSEKRKGPRGDTGDMGGLPGVTVGVWEGSLG